MMVQLLCRVISTAGANLKPWPLNFYANCAERAGAWLDLAVVSQHKLGSDLRGQPFVDFVQIARFLPLVFIDRRKERAAAGVFTHCLQYELPCEVLNVN